MTDDAAILERLRRLEQQQEAKNRANAALPQPRPSGFGLEMTKRQDAARRARLAAAEREAERVRAHVESVEPQAHDLRARLQACRARYGEEEARHAEAVDAIADEERDLNRELGELLTPPPAPAERPSLGARVKAAVRG